MPSERLAVEANAVCGKKYPPAGEPSAGGPADQGGRKERAALVVLALDPLDFLVEVLEDLVADLRADFRVVGDRVAGIAQARRGEAVHPLVADHDALAAVGGGLGAGRAVGLIAVHDHLGSRPAGLL